MICSVLAYQSSNTRSITMKKKLFALVCALALTFSFAGCTISTPDTVGSIGDLSLIHI